MLNKLNEKIKLLGKGPFSEEQPYLPYLVTCFQSNLAFRQNTLNICYKN